MKYKIETLKSYIVETENIASMLAAKSSDEKILRIEEVQELPKEQ